MKIFILFLVIYVIYYLFNYYENFNNYSMSDLSQEGASRESTTVNISCDDINDSVQCSNNNNCLFVNDTCIERSLASTIIINSR